MGLRPYELHTLTLGEFTLMNLAYEDRQQREDERARRIVEAIVNCAGFGSKKFTPKEELWPLAIDTRNEKQYIVNRRMAWDLLEGF